VRRRTSPTRVRILLEGRPGSGKTTVARRLADLLSERGSPPGGFVTEELRVRGRRVGFTVEAFEGARVVLAHVDLPGPPRVSRYGVDLGAFEEVALPALSAAREVFVVDELGKMELASEAFRAAVTELFERRVAIVATIHLARHPFTDELKRRRDVERVKVTVRERDSLPQRLADHLSSSDRA
jgi:nucleoside-triphosphatase